MKYPVLLFAVMLLLGAGCTKDEPVSDTLAAESADPTAARITFLSEIPTLGTNEIALNVSGMDGGMLTPENLTIAHEKLMHLIIVREDMTHYLHLHPEYETDAWRVLADFPAEGRYYVYVDIDAVDEGPVVLHDEITIGQEPATQNFPQPTSKTSTLDGIASTVTAGPGFIAGTDVMLNFQLTHNGQRIGNIAPYLGAYGHLVAFAHGQPEVYLHAHPLTEEAPGDGNVQFSIAFPAAGTYTLFPQFNINNEIRTFPVTVEVTGEGTFDDMVDSMHSGH